MATAWNTSHRQDDNPSSPYFLSSNESPTLVLVSTVLDGPNFHQWHRAMSMALLSKNKLQFVDGSIPVPARGDATFSAWQRCNNMVISWLIHSVSSSIAQSIIWIDSALEIWNDLHSRFSQSNFFRVCDLQTEIFNL